MTMLRILIIACAVSAIHAVECGQPKIQPNEMSISIVGGKEATPHSWPWMTEVVLLGEQWCGGTLINNQWIVSAAHCFDYNPRFYKFSVGGHTSTSFGGLDEPTRQTFSAQEIIKHEGYLSASEGNDIALIKLDGTVQFNDNVSPACLAVDRPEDGTAAYVTGWGGLLQKDPLDDNYNEYAEVLQQVMVPIVSNNDCQRVYRRFVIDDTMICAGYSDGGLDSCQGDSGGPMVVKMKTGFNKEQWTLTGIVSWGQGCAAEGKYGVYADVANLYQWIEATMAKYS